MRTGLTGPLVLLLLSLQLSHKPFIQTTLHQTLFLLVLCSFLGGVMKNQAGVAFRGPQNALTLEGKTVYARISQHLKYLPS